MRVGLGQALAQVQHQHRIEKGELGAAQQLGHFEFGRVGLARKGDLHVAVDHQFQEQFGQALADQGFVAQQHRPQLAVAARFERWAGQQLHQHAARVERQLAGVAQEKRSGRKGGVDNGVKRRFRQVHLRAPGESK